MIRMAFVIQIQKGGKPIGATSERKDGTYRKQAEGVWIKVLDPSSASSPEPEESSNTSDYEFEDFSAMSDDEIEDYIWNMNDVLESAKERGDSDEMDYYESAAVAAEDFLANRRANPSPEASQGEPEQVAPAEPEPSPEQPTPAQRPEYDFDPEKMEKNANMLQEDMVIRRKKAGIPKYAGVDTESLFKETEREVMEPEQAAILDGVALWNHGYMGSLRNPEIHNESDYGGYIASLTADFYYPSDPDHWKTPTTQESIERASAALKSLVGRPLAQPMELLRGIGLPSHVVESFQPGGTLELGSIASTTKNENVVDEFAQAPVGGTTQDGHLIDTPVIFHIDTDTGYDMSDLSTSPEEEEVLVGGTATIDHVVGPDDSDDGYHHVYMSQRFQP